MLIPFVLLLMLFTAPVVQAIFSAKRINNSCSLSLALLAFLCFLLGLVLSVTAVIVFMMLLPSDIKCATGCIGVAPLGFMITIITTPIIYFVYRSKYRIKQKNDQQLLTPGH